MGLIQPKQKKNKESGEWARKNTTSFLDAQIEYFEQNLASRYTYLEQMKRMALKWSHLDFADEIRQIEKGIKTTQEKLDAQRQEKQRVMGLHGWNN